jgi:hypothetical protein
VLPLRLATDSEQKRRSRLIPRPTSSWFVNGAVSSRRSLTAAFSPASPSIMFRRADSPVDRIRESVPWTLSTTLQSIGERAVRRVVIRPPVRGPHDRRRRGIPTRWRLAVHRCGDDRFHLQEPQRRGLRSSQPIPEALRGRAPQGGRRTRRILRRPRAQLSGCVPNRVPKSAILTCANWTERP